jgi:hypothetical protein
MPKAGIQSPTHKKKANGMGKYLHRINDQSRELRIHGMFDNTRRRMAGENRGKTLLNKY